MVAFGALWVLYIVLGGIGSTSILLGLENADLGDMAGVDRFVTVFFTGLWQLEFLVSRCAFFLLQ